MNKLVFNTHTEKAINRIIDSSVHAIGLAGEAGSGKTYIAKYLAARSLGIEEEKLAKNPYVLIIDCAQQVGIDDVREAIDFLTLKIPGEAALKRVLVFLNLEHLGLESQNALLKSIEEPPSDTLIIITVAVKSKLLPTTVSRVSWISVKPIDSKQAQNVFGENYSQQQIAKAYALSGGKVGLMSDLLSEGDEHPLAQNIAKAKELIAMDKFTRLSQVDGMNKDKDFNLELLLDSLKKVIEASLKNEISRTNQINVRTLDKLTRIIKAQNSGKYVPNQKILLTDILYNL